MTASIEKVGGTALLTRLPRRSPTRPETPSTSLRSGLRRNDDQWLSQLAISRWEAEGGALPRT
ncbi:hypothetical protein [Mycolicibacterium celeriflavum]|uniref:hypothetical protein n=1 Tax=Mycolicibacterium celeriflavum TaxID=1249101 RepID=UPI003CF3BEEE